MHDPVLTRSGPARDGTGSFARSWGQPLAFGLLAAALLAGGWNQFANQAAEQVAARERLRIAAVDELLSSVKDLEGGMRGYVLTGLRDYLEPYDAAVGQIDRDLAGPVPQTASPRIEGAPVPAPLGSLVTDEKAYAAAIVAARRDQGFDAASALIATGEGKRLMDAIRGAVRDVHERAEADISRSGQTDRSRFLVLTSVSLASAGLAVCLLARLVLLRRRESQRSGGLLEDVLDHAPVGLGFLDRRLKLQHMNLALSRISDGSLRTGLGAPMWAAHPALATQVQPLLQGALDRGLISTDVDVEVPGLDGPDGTRHLRMGFYPLRQHRGADTSDGVGVAVADVTNAKLSEERVRAGEATLRAVLDTLPVGVLIAEAPSGRITGHNSRSTEILGHDVLPSAPGAGAARWVGFHEDGRPVAPPDWPLIKVMREGRPFAELEVDYQRGDGRRSWIGFSGAPMRDAQGRVVGAVVVVSDIDARKRSEQLLAAAKLAAEDANLAKSTFLANMSHELRTPLSAIIGYSEMMLEEIEDAGDAGLERDMRKIEGNARHLLGLINDVLDLSKIESGKMELFAEDFDVEPMLRDLATTVGSLLAKKGNRLELEIGPDLGAMHADVTKIRQVLLNLLSNAAKFTENGTVTLSASRKAGTEACDDLVFTVADSGIGMNEEQLAKLFQRFQQADASTTRRFGGTGLGLSLTKAFADMLDGTISVQSQEGKGSVFTFVVPAVSSPPPEDSAGATAPEAAPEAGSAADLVLVIDDDPDQRTLMTRFLLREGFGVRTASDGASGLDAARRLRPRAILLDVMMPGVDGWSVLTELKADPDLAGIPVVMVTGMDQRSLAASLGAADYMLKPVRWDRFRDVMNRYRSPEGGLLLVDDDANGRYAIRSMLEDDGWEVTEASDGREGVRCATERRPAAVLLDLNMPVMDGFDFMMEFRRIPGCAEIPVVVLTARTLSNEDRRRLRGASQVLSKGDVSLRVLVDRLRQLADPVGVRPSPGADA